MLEAFLDGKTFITITSDNESEFYLNGDHLDAFFVSRIDNTLIYKATSEITLGVENYISDDFNNKTIIKVRNYVKDEEFDDEFYYEGDDLGANYQKKSTTFKVWAPVATKVVLEYKKDDKLVQVDMNRTNKGVHEVTIKGNLDGTLYRYLITNNGVTKAVIDPYSYSANENATYSAVIDLSKIKDNDITMPFIDKDDSIIYEMSIRDFSMDSHYDSKIKGTYKGVLEKGLRSSNNNKIGFDYLIDLGVTHIQLMPVLDFVTVDETNKFKMYNWGYDPFAFNVLEGSYSTNPYDPYSRIKEFKEFVEVMHKNNLRVNLDVVFNHTYSFLDGLYNNIVPNYFYLMDRHQTLSNGSFCGNDFDSLRRMARKYLKDICNRLITIYHVDGFRFDLMAILEKNLINDIYNNAIKINPSFLVYGEGWDMPSMIDPSIRASIKNSDYMPNIFTFNDYFRDTLTGRITDINNYKLGYLNGNGVLALNFIKAMKGSIDDGCYYNDPLSSLNYVECHDNYTLWDKLAIIRGQASEHDRNKMQLTSIAATLFAQGIPFLHLGVELNRTKKGDRNSYKSPDSINMINWDDVDMHQQNIKAVKDFIAYRKQNKLFKLKNKKEILKYIDGRDYGNGVTMFTIVKNGKVVIMVFNPTSSKKEVELNGSYNYVLNQYGKVNDDRTYEKILVSSYGFVLLEK